MATVHFWGKSISLTHPTLQSRLANLSSVSGRLVILLPRNFSMTGALDRDVVGPRLTTCSVCRCHYWRSRLIDELAGARVVVGLPRTAPRRCSRLVRYWSYLRAKMSLPLGAPGTFISPSSSRNLSGTAGGFRSADGLKELSSPSRHGSPPCSIHC